MYKPQDAHNVVGQVGCKVDNSRASHSTEQTLYTPICIIWRWGRQGEGSQVEHLNSFQVPHPNTNNQLII